MNLPYSGGNKMKVNALKKGIVTYQLLRVGAMFVISALQ